MRDRSRRALKQAAAIFLLVATLSVKLYPQAMELPRAFLMDAAAFPAAPLHFAVSQVQDFLDLALSSSSSRRQLDNEIKRLTAELVRKDIELGKARQTIASYDNLAQVQRRTPLFVWSGDLLGTNQAGDADVFSRSYIISVGGNEGVKKDWPVVWGNIAVGRISEVGLFYSRVRVLADPKSRVCVRFARSRREGVLVGSGRSACQVRFVSNNVEDGEIQVGDIVITSGTDGLFPPDLVVGTVTRFFRRPSQPEADVEVELFIDFSRLENCLVLRRDESFALAPGRAAR